MSKENINIFDSRCVFLPKMVEISETENLRSVKEASDKQILTRRNSKHTYGAKPNFFLNYIVGITLQDLGFQKKKPFLFGFHANRVERNLK